MSVPRRHARRSLWRVIGFVLLLGSFSASMPAYAWAGLRRFLSPLETTLASHSDSSDIKETWMGVYMNAKKIGYTSMRVAPTTYRNKPALRLSSQGITRLSILGSSVEQDETQVTIADLQYRPLKQYMDIRSNGSTLRLDAEYDYTTRKISCRLRAGETDSKKTLDIPPGANLAADTNFLANGKKLSVGDKVTFQYLNPLNVMLEEAQLEVSGRDKVKDNVTGETLSVILVKSRLSLGDYTSWQTEDGDTIKGEVSVGGIRMALVKETKETAQNMESTGSGEKSVSLPADFAVATSIQVDRQIEKPRELRSMSVIINGIPDKRYLISDARQKIEPMNTENPQDIKVRMDITALSFDARTAALLPIRDPALTPYVKKAAYLDTSDTNIRSMATRLRGKEKNAYLVASRIRDWVTKVMTPDASIGVPRGASDIFLRRRGVCRDYATLYTALARAAGIPTRLCGGIVYSQGRFYYHAWAESYVGDWVVFDPTLHSLTNPVDYVDATHIKFAQGDATEMFDTVGVVGKLKVVVLPSAQ